MNSFDAASLRPPARRGLNRLCLHVTWVALTACTCSAWGQTETALRYADGTAVQSEPLPRPLPPVNGDGGLTLEELEQKALFSNPSLRRLSALVGAARGNSLQVGLPPNPSVGYEGQQLGSGGLAEQHGVLFSQEIVRGGKLRLNRAVANSERLRIEQELAAQQMRVLTDVRIAYYEVLLAQRQIEIADNLIRIGSEGSETVSALFKAKEVGRADVLQAQLETENARILSNNAHNRYTAAWQSLIAIVGNPDLEPQLLEGDLLGPEKELDFQGSLDRLLQLSPEISAATMEVERARLSLERARVEPVPNVNLQGLVNWQDNGIGGKPDGGVAVSVPLPLFNRNQGAIARASQEYVAAREAVVQLELDLKNRLAPVFERYANAKIQFNRYQEIILPAAQESLDLTRKMYSAGETAYTTLLTAQRTYSQTQLNYLDTIRALRIAEAQINGLLLSGSLRSSPADESIGQASGRVSLPIGGVELFGH
jgi:cobalt-zinc-cadmium efflux system outer membrane protein